MPAARLTNDQRIADAPFQLPALLLLLSRRPEDFRGELLLRRRQSAIEKYDVRQTVGMAMKQRRAAAEGPVMVVFRIEAQIERLALQHRKLLLRPIRHL